MLQYVCHVIGLALNNHELCRVFIEIPVTGGVS